MCIRDRIRMVFRFSPATPMSIILARAVGSSMAAVSYTHLDVYKRQAQAGGQRRAQDGETQSAHRFKKS